MPDKCPICKSDLRKPIEKHIGGEAIDSFSCQTCGDFKASYSALSAIPLKMQDDMDASTKISFALRKMQSQNDEVLLTKELLDEIVKISLPTPQEQADLMLRWIAENVSGPGERIKVKSIAHRSIVGAKSVTGFRYVLRYLKDAKLIEGTIINTANPNSISEVTPSFKGWDRYEKLRQGGATYNKAFMAMKFDDPGLDAVINNLKDYIEQAGFELRSLKDNPKAGLIDNRLRVEIQSSDFLVADLSHDNLGAYWEAGYAEGLGKPVIYICEKEKFEKFKTHFDTNHHLTITWDEDELDEAGEELKATIRATLPHLAKLKD